MFELFVFALVVVSFAYARTVVADLIGSAVKVSLPAPVAQLAWVAVASAVVYYLNYSVFAAFGVVFPYEWMNVVATGIAVLAAKPAFDSVLAALAGIGRKA